MSIQSVYAFGAAVDQIDKSVKNLAAIQEARGKRQREQEEFDLKKKKTKLELQELELKNQNSAIENARIKNLVDEELKLEKAALDGKKAQVDMAEHGEKERLAATSELARGLFKTDPDVHQYVLGNIRPELAQAAGPGGRMIQGQAEYGGPPALGSITEDIGANNPRLSAGKKGLEIKNKDPKDVAFERIVGARNAGIPLTAGEQDVIRTRTGMPSQQKADERRLEKMEKVMGALDGEIDEKFITDRKGAEAYLNKKLGINWKSKYPEARQYLDETMGGGEDNRLTDISGGSAGRAMTRGKNIGASNKVRVQAPDGRIGMIPKSQLEAAKQQGFSLAK